MTGGDEIIHRDHVNLDKVLSVLESTVDLLTSDKGGAGEPSAVSVLHSIVYYIRTFPDRMHHPKEEAYLFPLLFKRRPDAHDLIATLEAQHSEGEALILELNDAVTGFDKSSAPSKERLQETSKAYIKFQRQHIGLEERELLPMARQSLSVDDWNRVQKAFVTDSDPLFGENIETGFRILFEHITKSR